MKTNLVSRTLRAAATLGGLLLPRRAKSATLVHADYGVPDSDETTKSGRVWTRVLVYGNAHAALIFVSDDRGSNWHLASLRDSETQAVLLLADFRERMKRRENSTSQGRK